jgi:hypothetical protein
MDPKESQRFRTVRVKAGATLTVREWDGSSGGELRLEALRVIIEEVRVTHWLSLASIHTGRDNRCVWEGRPRWRDSECE